MILQCSSGEMCLFEGCSAVPLKAHANRLICKRLLSLRPRRGSICSPPHSTKPEQTGESSVNPPVNSGMFCFLGTHPG